MRASINKKPISVWYIKISDTCWIGPYNKTPSKTRYNYPDCERVEFKLENNE